MALIGIAHAWEHKRRGTDEQGKMSVALKEELEWMKGRSGKAMKLLGGRARFELKRADVLNALDI